MVQEPQNINHRFMKVAMFNKNVKSQLLKGESLRKKLIRKGTTADLDTMIDPHTDPHTALFCRAFAETPICEQQLSELLSTWYRS